MSDVAVLKHRNPQSASVPEGARTSAPESTRPAASEPPYAPVYAMLTHRGQRRQINQDACAARPDQGAFVVCDGMGGAAAGEIASRLACQAFVDCIAQRCCPPPDVPDLAAPPLAAEPPSTPNLIPLESIAPFASAARAPHAARPRTRLGDAVRAANQAVFRHSRKSSSLHGMGTTLVALLWEPPTPSRPFPPIWLAHVGDSRCYRLRDGILQQLTEDHSLVEEQVRAGVLSHLQANASPMRNIITRAIGSHPTVEAAIATHATQPGDLYLLASDGLTRELDDAAIAGILNRIAIPALLDSSRRAAPALALQAALDAACHALVDAANAHGGRDNITVLLVPCL